MEKVHITKPKKIPVVKPSKYEAGSAFHECKEYWGKVFNEMDNTISQPTSVTESRRLKAVLPDDLYQRVCPILNLPVIDKPDEEISSPKAKVTRRLLKQPMLSFRKTLYIDREADSDTDVEYSSSEEEKPNIHRELLKKPLREQITWDSHYLLPEREDEKSLLTKSDDVTDRIAKEFCQYMTQLGGNQQSQLFTPKAIKELFQVEFNKHVARGLQVVPQEVPAIIDKVANVTGHPEKSLQSTLKREIAKDIREENREDFVKAFGTTLPYKEQWHVPKNNTKQMWRSSRYVPKDLVTMKTVWEGITNLRSVREYCRWMIDHPEYRRAPYLRSLGMFDKSVLSTRMTLELAPHDLPPQNNDSIEKPTSIDHIRRRLSELAETT